MPLLNSIYGIPVVGPQNWSNLVSSYVGLARFNFFRSDTTDAVANLAEIDGVDICTTVITFFMIMFREALGFFSASLVLIVVGTLWIATTGLTNLIESDPSYRRARGME